jgi:hypothetical protein
MSVSGILNRFNCGVWAYDRGRWCGLLVKPAKPRGIEKRFVVVGRNAELAVPLCVPAGVERLHAFFVRGRYRAAKLGHSLAGYLGRQRL